MAKRTRDWAHAVRFQNRKQCFRFTTRLRNRSRNDRQRKHVLVFQSCLSPAERLAIKQRIINQLREAA